VRDREALDNMARRYEPAVIISAQTGEGLDGLRAAIAALARRQMIELEALLPYDRGDLLSLAYEHGQVERAEHRADGVFLVARLPAEIAAKLDGFAIEDERGAEEL
jgi:GTP-binding protein HflX